MLSQTKIRDENLSIIQQYVTLHLLILHWMVGEPDSSVGKATDYGLDGRIPVGTRFSARPDRPWGPPSLLHNGYRVFPGGKVRPGHAADHSLPSSATVMEE